jgi:glyoxylase-like metal-dependent hydrolase (beta-lactamase superfamily II)
MKPVIVFTLLTITILPTTPSFSQEVYKAHTVKVTDHIYKFIHDAGGMTVNTVAFTGDEGVLLVDTGLMQTAPPFKEELKKIGADKPEYIVITHEHRDHLGGNKLFGKEPTIIGHDIIRNRVRSGTYVIEEYPDYALPEITFTDSLTILFNGEEIRVIAIPGSQSDNDAIVWFVNSKVVCMGDIVYGLSFPTVDGNSGSALKYPEVVKRALEILPDDVTIISGHGRDLTMDELREYYEMLDQTVKTVSKEHAKGKTSEEMIEGKILSRWDSYSNDFIVTTDGWITTIVNSLNGFKPKPSIVEPLYHTLKDGDATKAIEKYHELQENHPDEYSFTSGWLFMLAINYLTPRERYEETIQIYEFIIDEFPDDPYLWIVYHNIGETFMELDNKALAIKNFNKSLEIFPQNTLAVELMKSLE